MEVSEITQTLLYQFPKAPEPLINDAVHRAVRRFFRDSLILTDLLELEVTASSSEYKLVFEECQVPTKIISAHILKDTVWEKVGYIVKGHFSEIWLQDPDIWVKGVDPCDSACTPKHRVRVEYAWTINSSSCDFPDGVIDNFLDEILLLTSAFLYRMVGFEWSNPELSIQAMAEYQLSVDKLLQKTDESLDPTNQLDYIKMQFKDAPAALIADVKRRATQKFFMDTRVLSDVMSITVQRGDNEFRLEAPPCRVIADVRRVELYKNGCWVSVPFDNIGAFETVKIFDDDWWPGCEVGQCESASCVNCQDECNLPEARVEYDWYPNDASCDVPASISGRYTQQIEALTQAMMLGVLGNKWTDSAQSYALMKIYDADAAVIRASVADRPRDDTDHGNPLASMKLMFKGSSTAVCKEVMRLAEQQFLRDTWAASDTVEFDYYPGQSEYVLPCVGTRTIIKVSAVELFNGTEWVKYPYEIGGMFETFRFTGMSSHATVSCRQSGCESVAVDGCMDGCATTQGRITYVWTTADKSCDRPTQITDQHTQTIKHLARALMLTMPGQAWTDMAAGLALMAEYKAMASEIRARVTNKFSSSRKSMRPTHWPVGHIGGRSGRYS